MTQPFSVEHCPGVRNRNKCTKGSRPSIDGFFRVFSIW